MSTKFSKVLLQFRLQTNIINECASNPCGANSLSCTDLLNAYNCTCKAGFGGKRCEVDLGKNFDLLGGPKEAHILRIHYGKIPEVLKSIKLRLIDGGLNYLFEIFHQSS